MGKAKIITEEMAFSALKPRDPFSNKGTYGKLLCLCGSRRFPGAAVLAVGGALRSGAGIVCLASIENVVAAVAAHSPSCTFLPLAEGATGCVGENAAPVLLAAAETSDALLAGCGLTCCKDVELLISRVVREAPCILVLDADALNVLAGNPMLLREAKKVPVITPHVGEMARLCGMEIADVKKNAEALVKERAQTWNTVVVLKDHITHIGFPDGSILVNTTGNAGLAKGGSGDVLAGMISSLIAQGIEPEQAVPAAVYLHGAAADRAARKYSQYGMLPTDLPLALCELFSEHGL